MTIYFKAGGLLKSYLNPDVDEFTRKIEITEGQSVLETLAQIQIKPSLVSMALLEGKIIPMSYKPREGDVITLRPPVQGG